ncbi:hypothetical protein BHM03_00001052 [Ensete ventricosum]|nr:hypothetical protein BHM03_00001052 [Ensete ventricosum]
MSFYSNGYGAPVPEVLTAPVAYHAVVLRRSFRGPRGEVRDVPPATGEGRSCPPYLCQVGRMTADPPMLVSGRPRRWSRCPGAQGHGKSNSFDRQRMLGYGGVLVADPWLQNQFTQVELLRLRSKFQLQDLCWSMAGLVWAWSSPYRMGEGEKEEEGGRRAKKKQGKEEGRKGGGGIRKKKK